MPVLGAVNSSGIPRANAPTLFEGFSLNAYGHSYVFGSGASGLYGYAPRLQARLALKQVNNAGVSGTSSGKILAGQVWMGFTGYPATAPAVAYLFDYTQNDAQTSSSTPTAKQLARFTNSVTLMATQPRAGSRVMPGDAGTAFSGFASDTSADYTLVGSVAPYTATASGSTVTITGLSAGEKVCLSLTAVDDATAATPGGAYSISTSSSTSGSTVVATGSTSNQFFKGAEAGSLGHLPVFVTVPATGTAQTIVITKTDGATTKLGFNGLYRNIKTTGPVQFHLKQPPTPSNDASANLAAFQSAQASALAALGGSDIYLVDPTVYGWDKTKHVAPDNNHPNDAGHSIIADAITAVAMTVTADPSRSSV